MDRLCTNCGRDIAYDTETCEACKRAEQQGYRAGIKALYDLATEKSEVWWMDDFLTYMIEDLIGKEEASKLLAEQEEKG